MEKLWIQLIMFQTLDFINLKKSESCFDSHIEPCTSEVSVCVVCLRGRAL